ncbi:50S ribosomal protein L21 [Buchnera aphidicola (Pseudoregma panicola)]|uniref:50S ribosomal protein L21 n=1 Tax=Buchnera aphidicola TaxID=9 RepID=UPI0031B81FE3
MKAIFIINNNQYMANVGDTINVEKLNLKIGETITSKKVLMICKNKNSIIGKPFLKKEYVSAKIKSHNKKKKINIIKFKRRKHYKKKQGHRQKYTIIKIIKISNNTGI